MNNRETIDREYALKRLLADIKEGEVVFEYDDGWNSREWHKGVVEITENSKKLIKSLDNYTWEGRWKAHTRWGSKGFSPEEIKVLS